MIYIAFLQSIKIGKYKINMTELKYLFISLGFKNVETYYQNGNVVFQSNKNEVEVRKLIEKEIIIRYRNVIPVVIRNVEEFKQIVNNISFTTNNLKEFEEISKEDIFIVLFKEKPKKDNIIKNISDYVNEFILVNRELYIVINKINIRNIVFINFLKQIDIHATIRDWSIIKRIYKKI